MIHCHKHKIDYGYEPCPSCIGEDLANKAFDKVLAEASKLKTVNETLEERAKTHGDFSKYCEIMDIFMRPMEDSFCEFTPEQEHGIYMIFSKLARIVNGDSNHADSWHDIAGYATLVERSINNGN